MERGTTLDHTTASMMEEFKILKDPLAQKSRMGNGWVLLLVRKVRHSQKPIIYIALLFGPEQMHPLTILMMTPLLKYKTSRTQFWHNLLSNYKFARDAVTTLTLYLSANKNSWNSNFSKECLKRQERIFWLIIHFLQFSWQSFRHGQSVKCEGRLVI